MDDQIPFIHAHHHLWNLDLFTPSRVRLEPEEAGMDYTSIRGPYLIEDLLTNFVGPYVGRSVCAQTDHADLDPVEEAPWLQSIADVAYGEAGSVIVG